MRVAHVITRMIVGGAQENTLLCCADLIRDFGDDVLLITGPALGPEGDLLAQLPDVRVPLAVLPELRRAIHPWRDWRSYQALRRTLRAFRPDVVHTHSAKGGFLGRLAACSLDVPAIVHTVHGAPFHPYQGAAARAVFRRLERFAARRCDLLVSVADAMTELLVEAGVAPREQFETVYSGMKVEPFLAADETRDEVRRALGYSADHVVIGKIARLFHLKGHDDLLEAARRMRDRCPQARFLLIGDGILRGRLEARLAQLDLQDRFRFTGLVPPEEIPRLVGAMDILVHASLREGLARALPQALIAARPVVSYDVDGAREVIVSGETGMLVPPRDVRQLTESLVRLIEDPALRTRLGEAGRTRCAAAFDHRQMTARLRQLYQQVVEGRRGRGGRGGAAGTDLPTIRASE